ncbi:hypothetical protein Droror1_Dr00002163 [Drosera rotundifolia]
MDMDMNITTTRMAESEVDTFKHRVDEVLLQVNTLEKRVHEIEILFANNRRRQLNNSKGSSIGKDKDKEKHVSGFKKHQQDGGPKAAANKRMQELMRQFGLILRQITQHSWAAPFKEPVDTESLGLDDYYQIIEKPMDFGTIKRQMDAKDGSGYKHVREIYADVRLVFNNAMKYNDEKHDIHIMAKSLLAKFEEKWLVLLPKVTEEEKRLEEEEAEAKLSMQLAQKAAHAKTARDLSNELYEVDMHLEELRELVVQKCRKMSTEEKRQIGTALSRLSADDLSKALEIVAQCNSGFQIAAEEVDLDIDALSESTLWRLKFFVKDALQARGNPTASTCGNNDNDGNNAVNHTKRKREISDAVVKTAKKKSKKVPS